LWDGENVEGRNSPLAKTGEGLLERCEPLLRAPLDSELVKAAEDLVVGVDLCGGALGVRLRLLELRLLLPNERPSEAIMVVVVAKPEAIECE